MASRAVRVVLQLVGLALLTLLVSRLPDDVFALTQGILLVAAAALLVLVALGAVLPPARALLQRIFAMPQGDVGPVLGQPQPPGSERVLVPPTLAAVACLFVAMVAALLR